MLTRRARVLIAAAAIVAGFVGGATAHVWNPYAATPASLEMFEDGSGILHLDGQRYDIEDGTFRWDCATMGNRTCGDVDDIHIP